MRVVRLVLLGVFVYLIAMVVFFPAAPVIEYVKPQLKPLVLNGVSGKLYKGEVASVVSEDELLPLIMTDVRWTLAPSKLLSGAGANISYNTLGGSGKGQVLRTWGGDIALENFTMDAQAKELEAFLPVPIASFEGKIEADFDELKLVKQQLSRALGSISWTDANIDTVVFGPQISLALGTLLINVEPEEGGAHKATINATGGEITADGVVNLAANGDFNLNVLLTPSAETPRALINHLQRTTRPESGGRFRWTESGNLNRLM